MARMYKKVPGAKTIKKYSQETLNHAVIEIREKKISLNAAHLKYNIPKGTLSFHVNAKESCTPLRKHGGQNALSAAEESQLCDVLIKTSSWGFPLTHDDLRYITKAYLSRQGKVISKFKNNFPGDDWARSFMKRHKEKLSKRKCTNITPQRASVDEIALNNFFDNLTTTLKDIPATNVFNYDETNVSDNPGSKKCIFKRGVKHPERLMGHSKSSISLMFCGSAAGKLLPIYTVYKAENMWSTWVEGGPPGCRYNRTSHGWFDECTFTDWFKTIFLTEAKSISGKKILIGDNLASHFSAEVLELCEQHDISFICFPPNSTHLLQPLDVAVFGPLKRVWREILSNYKVQCPSSCQTGLQKAVFPSLLLKLWNELHANDSIKKNLIAGFRSTGIVPLNKNKVLNKIPSQNANEATDTAEALNDSVVEYLKSIRNQKKGLPKRRKRKIIVEPGKSITSADLQAVVEMSESLPSTSARGINNKRSKTKDRKKRNKEFDEDSEDDDEVPTNLCVDSSDDENFIEEMKKNPLQEFEEDEGPVKVSDFLLITVKTEQKLKFKSISKCKHFVGQVMEHIAPTNEYLVKFMKREEGSKFSWPDNEDIALVSDSDIKRKLPQPTMDRRLCFIFPVSFDCFIMG